MSQQAGLGITEAEPVAIFGRLSLPARMQLVTSARVESLLSCDSLLFFFFYLTL